MGESNHGIAWRPRAARSCAGVQPLEPRVLLSTVEVVKDLDLTTASAFPSTGYQIVMSGERAFFTPASTPHYGSEGKELWVSDGTPAGTHMTRDVRPGIQGSNNNYVVPIANGAVFDADGATWRSDGTEAGTYRLAGGAGSTFDLALSSTARLGAQLFATAYDAANGLYGLGVTDGTVAGTRVVRWMPAPPPGTYAGPPDHFTVMGGVVYFSAADGGGTELWRSDGTDGGTYRVADIVAGATGSEPDDLVAAGGKLFFTAKDPTNGRELWVYDGAAAGPRLIANLTYKQFDTTVNGAAAVNGVLVFQTSDPDAGAGLWRSDGTPGGTYRVKAFTGAVYSILSGGPRGYFAQGTTFWSTDGSTVQQVASATQTPGVSAGGEWGLLGQRLVFRGTTTAGGAEPWVTDGTAAGTFQLADAAPGAASSNAWRFAAAEGSSRTFFAADAKDGRGFELWVTDGTAGGTRAVTDVNRVTPSSSPWQLTKVGAAAYFSVRQAGANRGLWRTDGTAAGTAYVSPVEIEVDSSLPNLAIGMGDRLFFSGRPAAAGAYELYVSDGSGGGTKAVKDVAGGSAVPSPRDLTVAGGSLFLFATPAGGSRTLYRVDALGAGAAQVAGGVNAGVRAVLGGAVYFAKGAELWKAPAAAGGAAELVKAGLGSVTGISTVGDRLLIATTTGGEVTLYRSDGTTAGTELIVKLPASGYAAGPAIALPGGGAVFAYGNPWFTDLTAAGTRKLDPDVTVNAAVLYHGQVYFDGGALQAHADLRGFWTTDGTVAGTRLVLAGQNPQNLAVAGGRMFFLGFDAAHGQELWESDGTADGTAMVTDLAPLTESGGAVGMTDLDGDVLFIADDRGDHQQEVYKVLADRTPPVASAAAHAYVRVGAPALSVRFSERVAASLTAGDFVVTRRDTGAATPTAGLALTYDGAANAATLALPAALADGNYRLTFAPGGVADAAGNPLAGGFSFDFFVMAGDANHDRTVDFNDLVPLAQHYNTAGGMTFGDGDFNYDGNVDFDDVVLLAQRYNTTLASGGAGAAAPALALPAAQAAVFAAFAPPATGAKATKSAAKPSPVKSVFATAVPARKPKVARPVAKK